MSENDVKDKDTELETKNNEPQEAPVASEASTTQVIEHSEVSKSGNKFKRFWRAYLSKKKRNIPLTVIALIALIMAVPFSRYKVLGLVIKRQFSVVVIDSTSNEPVTSASVSLNGNFAKTDKDGKATLNSSVGNHTLQVIKKYYQDYKQNVLVPVGKTKDAFQVKLQATGRQVPVTVINKINGQAVEGVTITGADTEARTDNKGSATIVLPADVDTVSATLSVPGYNDTTVTIQVTDQQTSKNNFTMVPSGKVYFLSKATGKIDVVKTNLDGSDRQTVLAGTGKEDDSATTLLASRDWKYLALLARRDSALAKLYLINTATDKLTTIDEGDASFSLIGWHDHDFGYTVDRNNIDSWKPNGSSIKSFNADSGQLKILDNTGASGTNADDAVSESYNSSQTFILGDKIVFTKYWFSNVGSVPSDKKNSITSVSFDGNTKKVISAYGANSYFFGGAYEPNVSTIKFEIDNSDSGNSNFYSLDELGNFKLDNSITADDFAKAYPTFLISPSGNETFWSEPRDGKNTLFIGDKNGDNGKEIASLSDYSVYGWFTNDYLLVSKNSSELYIMSRNGGKVLKITDYHKPDQSFYGYGGGYGGI